MTRITRAPMHVEPLSQTSSISRKEPLLPSDDFPPPPASGMHAMWHACIWPGMGLLGESFLLFGMGILTPLWQQLFPNCFVEYFTCNQGVVESLPIATIGGVLLGMLLFSVLASSRRVGSIVTASVMALASIGLTAIAFLAPLDYQAAAVEQDEASWKLSEPLMLRSMVGAYFLLGLGVGGEYPMAAASASERTMTGHPHNNSNSPFDEHNKHRGRTVQLVFSMQGVGIFLHCVVLSVLLICTGQTTTEYSAETLLRVWQVLYGIGTFILVVVWISRLLFLQESQVWRDYTAQHAARQKLVVAAALTQSQKQPIPPPASVIEATPGPILETASTVSSLSAPSVEIRPNDISSSASSRYGPDEDDDEEDSDEDDDDENDNYHYVSTNSIELYQLQLFVRHYGVRVIGVSLCWFFWDVAFYGNKLFQSDFLLALTGERTSLLKFSLAATLNAGVALAGYFGAALLLDRPDVGRCRLQLVGFVLTGTLFVGAGFMYGVLPANVLVAMYLGSSFFGQLGPNATTFLLPAEICPTEFRTATHGLAAASGKAGALLATYLFKSLESDVDMFLVAGYASFCAALVTFYTLPETAGLPLQELDQKWQCILLGNKATYTGPANWHVYRSYWERQWTQKKSRARQLQDSDHHLDLV